MTQPTSLRIYSHSTLLYWWPVWLSGFVLAGWTWFFGESVTVDGKTVRILSSAAPGFLFEALLLLTIFTTSVRLKGMRSVVFSLIFLVVLILLAWAGWLDNLVRAVPAFSTHFSAGAYLVLSTGLLVLWSFVIFGIDRLAHWRIAAGQLTRIRTIGAAEKSFDARGMTVEREPDDLLRHFIFGLGSGDVVLHTSGAGSQKVPLANVLFVSRKIDLIQKLVSVEPDSLGKAPDA